MNLKIIFTFILVLVIFLSCSKEIDEPDVLKDVDGNIYTTVQIGTQTWMVENFKAIHFNDGTEIKMIIDDSEWANITKAGYCWISDNEYYKMFGAFYNWYAINSEKFCPKGWRVPSEMDWRILREYLIANGYNYDGSISGDKIGKSLAKLDDPYCSWFYHWSQGVVGNYDSIEKYNTSKFSAYPIGFRRSNGLFTDYSASTIWWCAPDMKTQAPKTLGIVFD